LFFADTNAFAASDTGQTKSACYHSCVAGSAAACCQDTLSNEHPMHIIRASLRAYQDNRRASFAQFLGSVSIKDCLTISRAGRSVQTLCQQATLALGAFLLFLVKAWQEQLINVRGLDAADGILLRDQSLLDHIHGNLDC